MPITYDELISKFPKTQKSGKGVLVKCPAHNDHNPSLKIEPSDGNFTISVHCFSGCDGKDILNALGYKWIDFSRNGTNKEQQTKTKLIKEYTEVLANEKLKIKPDYTILAQHMHNNLLSSDIAKKYLYDRLIDDDDIERWNLGYSNEKDAISIPHIEIDGTVVGIKYRLLNPPKDRPKYMSESGSDLFTLYNSDALNNERVFLAEGEFDCILLNKSGFEAIALPSGANSFKPEYVKLFDEVKEFYLLLDNDEGGIKGMEKIQSMLGDKAIPVMLPDKMDITDYFKSGKNPDDLYDLIKSTKKSFDRKLRLSRGELLNILELDGFLRSYIDYAHKFTSAPKELHLAVGLAVLSATLTNKVYTYVWGKRLYPNIWMVEVADSGICRKTTAMTIGTDILRDVDSTLVLPNELTREKFWDYLSTQPFGLMPIWEFSSMTENLDKEYQVGLKADLTSIFDASSMKRQTKAETQELKDCALTILSATTINWMQVKKDDFKGGFFARFLYMPAHFTMDDWKGLVTYKDMLAREDLINWLKMLYKLNGELDLSLVDKKINDWLRKHDERVFIKEPNSDLDGFYSRAGTLIIKLAILFEVSHSGGLIVSEQSADNAITLIEYLERCLETVIQGKMFENPTMKNADRVVSIITRNNGKMDRTKLANTIHLDKKKLDDAISTAEDMGLIKTTLIKGDKSDKPKTILELVIKQDGAKLSVKP